VIRIDSGNLLTLFLSAFASKLCDLPFTTVDTVFKEMVRKFAHIRVQEQKGNTTLAGQNLCDLIMTHYLKQNSSINVI